MAIKIVDAEYSQLQTVKRAGKARSKDTLDLIAAIKGLGARQAKALVVDRGDSAAKLRAKVSNAARLAGVKVRIVIVDNKVIFGKKRGKAGGARVGLVARRTAVRQKAIQLAKGGKKNVSAADVLKGLESDGVELNATRPATLIGAVLRNMPEFEKTGTNTFKYTG